MEDTPVQHVSRKTLEHYVPEAGRRVNLWSLKLTPQDFFEEVQQTALKVTKAYLEAGMEMARDRLIGAEAHARSEVREDYRNGFYVRKRFQTAIGRIQGLRVPRCRKRSLVRAMAAQLARTEGAFEAQVVEMFLRGLSVRSIGPLLDGLLGLPVSPSQVSKLARRCDAQVRQYHQKPLEDRYEYLFFDGIHLKRRSTPSLFRRTGPARRRVVLVCYGVTRAGARELIGFRLEASEGEAGWRRFLGGLRRRGLTGACVRLVITDGGQGLINALDDFYPESPRQRCWFHKISNVLSHVRKAHQARCLQGLRHVYAAPNRTRAQAAFQSWARQWAKVEPAAVRCVERDLDALLAFYALPKAHHKMLRTTNAIERCFREVRRRTRAIGCFVNDESLERMLFGLFRFLNQRRAQKPLAVFPASRSVA
jgi:transposase-like protein